MDVQFLGQGYEEESPNSVGNHLIRLLADDSFNKLTILTAFTSPTGVVGLSTHIANAKDHLEDITIVTGIDQKGTSKDALESLMELNIKSYVFYQPSNPIFHPKIYFFEGKERSELIVGSSNLTATGLFSNIEASLLAKLDNAKDSEIIDQVKEYFKGIFDDDDPNLRQLDKELVDNLVKAKLVPTERERKQLYKKSQKKVSEKVRKLVQSLFPKRKNPNPPQEFRRNSTRIKKSKKKKTAIAINPAVPSTPGNIAWSRSNLPASSVQASPGGNPTGGLRLVQAGFKVNDDIIDQTTYFRNDVFGSLDWIPSGDSEIATTLFDVFINGNYIGAHKLEIRHKPSGEAGQGNYTTLISWGHLGETIKDSNLTGKALTLNYPSGESTPYTISIN